MILLGIDANPRLCALMCAELIQDVNEMLTPGRLGRHCKEPSDRAHARPKADLVRDTLDLIDRVVLAADR
jgi:hypothetical protein